MGDHVLPLPAVSVRGELGSHDLALAHLGGTAYFASLHGRTHHDADAAMLLAMLLTAGAPAGESGKTSFRDELLAVA